MKKVTARRSIKTKILGIVFLSVFLITTILGFLSFEFSKRRLITMLGDSAKGIATALATMIRQDDIALIMANADSLRERYQSTTSKLFYHIYEKKSEAKGVGQDDLVDNVCIVYTRYSKLLQDIKTMNKIDSPINIYAVDKNRLKLVLASEPVLLTGSIYSIRPEAQNALSTELPQSTGIYKDKDGAWISAYAVIPEAEHKNKKAIVEVNYRINSYINKLNGEVFVIVSICLAGLIGTALIGYKLTSNLVSAITRLDKAVEELETERYDTLIDVKSDDEIGHLAETFEMLRVSIKQKIEELRLSLVREKRAHLESVVALTNAIEMRDPYTSQHLRRVEKYALLIAKSMRLPRADMQKLKYSCFLHDIGKIYIETSLLQKIKLSSEDYAEIKKHSERGAKIIEGIQFLTGVKDAVLYHQERYDGKGYPKGLKSEEIPLLARIVSVADAFDAITTDRPYKNKLSFSEAMDEIEKNSGTQFDPVVCNALLKYRNLMESIAKKHFEKPIITPPRELP